MNNREEKPLGSHELEYNGREEKPLGSHELEYSGRVLKFVDRDGFSFQGYYCDSFFMDGLFWIRCTKKKNCTKASDYFAYGFFVKLRRFMMINYITDSDKIGNIERYALMIGRMGVIRDFKNECP